MSMDENPTRAPEEPATKDVGELQPSGAPVVTADLDDHTGSLDAVAAQSLLMIESGYESDPSCGGRDWMSSLTHCESVMPAGSKQRDRVSDGLRPGQSRTSSVAADSLSVMPVRISYNQDGRVDAWQREWPAASSAARTV